MDVETVKDVASFDPYLLNLQEISPIALKDNLQIAGQLYLQWLTLPETGKLVRTLIDDAKSGLPLNAAESSNGTNSTTTSPLPSMFPAGNAPLLSPRSSSGSSLFMKINLSAVLRLYHPSKS